MPSVYKSTTAEFLSLLFPLSWLFLGKSLEQESRGLTSSPCFVPSLLCSLGHAAWSLWTSVSLLCITCIYVLSCFSRVRLFVTLQTVSHQAPLSIGILQARILEWVAMPSSRGSFRSRGWTCVSYISCTGRQVLYHSTTCEVQKYNP